MSLQLRILKIKDGLGKNYRIQKDDLHQQVIISFIYNSMKFSTKLSYHDIMINEINLEFIGNIRVNIRDIIVDNINERIWK